MAYDRSVAWIADTHLGNPYAPWPKEQEIAPGFTIDCGEPQETLGRYRDECIEKMKDYDVDTVIFVGDLIDGNNRKEFGRDRITTDIDIQAEAALKWLMPFCEGRRVFGISGTGYHDSVDSRKEHGIIENLGTNKGDGYWGPYKNVRMNGSVISVSHGQGGALIYRATKSDRELLHALAGEASGKIPCHIDLFVRAHLHFFGYLDNGPNAYLAVPCFCDWIPYKFSLMLYGRQPDIGMVITVIDKDGAILPKKILFPLPGVAQRPAEI